MLLNRIFLFNIYLISAAMMTFLSHLTNMNNTSLKPHRLHHDSFAIQAILRKSHSLSIKISAVKSLHINSAELSEKIWGISYLSVGVLCARMLGKSKKMPKSAPERPILRPDQTRSDQIGWSEMITCASLFIVLQATQTRLLDDYCYHRTPVSFLLALHGMLR